MSEPQGETPAAVYSLDRLIAEARRLAAEYRRATGRPLPGVSAEIAEHDAARILGLELMQDRSQGFDAVGRGPREGLRYQIKGRAVFADQRGGQRIGELKAEREWDRLALVILDDDFEPVEILETERAEVVAALAENESSNRRKRGALSLAKLRAISRVAWDRAQGHDPEVWDNQAEAR